MCQGVKVKSSIDNLEHSSIIVLLIMWGSPAVMDPALAAILEGFLQVIRLIKVNKNKCVWKDYLRE